MRKTSQKFNSETVIHNIWELCGEKAPADEIPYWETINKYLERLDEKTLYRVHNKGIDREYTEYYYYVLEAKIVLSRISL